MQTSSAATHMSRSFCRLCARFSSLSSLLSTSTPNGKRPGLSSALSSLLVTALGHIQQQLPVDRIGAFNAKLLSDFAASRAALMQDIGSTGVLTDENRKAILEQAKRSLADFLSAEAGSGR